MASSSYSQRCPSSNVFHELRHYYASLLIHAGESVTTVQAETRPQLRDGDTGHLWAPLGSTLKTAPEAWCKQPLEGSPSGQLRIFAGMHRPPRHELPTQRAGDVDLVRRRGTGGRIAPPPSLGRWPPPLAWWIPIAGRRRQRDPDGLSRRKWRPGGHLPTFTELVGMQREVGQHKASCRPVLRIH